MPSYTFDQLDDLEEQAEETTEQYQRSALAIVSSLLEQHAISYGLMGGMNFFLRGSGRTTGDVDIAVDNQPRMDSLLNIFNNHSNIWRPRNKMQWASGVARLFVDVQGKIVQIDLKPKGAEGHLIPGDLRAAVESLAITSTTQCKFLRIGPLVAAKIKAHYGRETRDDYRDLMFVCTSSTYAPMARQAANTFRREWKESFLEKVIQNAPGQERQVRWALNMERSPSPQDANSQNRSGGNGRERRGGGSGDGSGSGSCSGGSASRSAPRDGDKSADGYWTFSARYNKWYHRSSIGDVKWAK